VAVSRLAAPVGLSFGDVADTQAAGRGLGRISKHDRQVAPFEGAQRRQDGLRRNLRVVVAGRDILALTDDQESLERGAAQPQQFARKAFALAEPIADE
jgi:hypothetical protein